MTRKEEIHKEALLNYDDNQGCSAFILGAEWADKYPICRWRTDLVPDFYSNILMKLNKNGKRIVTLGCSANGVIFSENRDLTIEKSDVVAWMPIIQH